MQNESQWVITGEPMRFLYSLVPAIVLVVWTQTTFPSLVRAAEPARPQALSTEFLPGVTRILMLGDSITYAGQYVDNFETELMLRFPERKFEVINCGLSSETVSGLSEVGHAGGKFPRPDLHERLARVLAKTKPDLVFACYGMNDGIYLPLSDERLNAFKAGMKRLHEAVTAAGAKIIHLTPPVFDPMPIRAKVVSADKVDAGHPYEGYDTVLAAYGQWLLEQRQAGWQVIDIHGPMSASIAEHRKTEPNFSFSGDGVHPNAAGHAVMSQAIIKGLAAPFDPADEKFGSAADRKSVYSQVQKLVHDRGRIMIDAWLTETGHKRPMKAGLPMPEAKEKADKLTQSISNMLEKAK